MCDALRGFHPFMGSDYTPCFKDKGKVRPFKIMQGNQSYMKAFKDLGSSEVIHEETLNALEKFVCQVYGDKKCESVNELRHKKLVSKGNNRKKKPPATSAASSDDQASPEKQKNLVDLYKKMKRTNPVSFPPAVLLLSNRFSEQS